MFKSVLYTVLDIACLKINYLCNSFWFLQKYRWEQQSFTTHSLLAKLSLPLQISYRQDDRKTKHQL